MANEIQIDYGLQVIFSTIPHNCANSNYDFEEDLESHYFKSYRNDIKSNADFPFLYHPIKYYMFGEFDVVYISLINNFKFSHRLFEPKSQSKNEYVYNAHTFNSYSGLALDEKSKLKELFNPINIENKLKLPLSYFIGIIHLKLNNGIYIGNGQAYILVIKKFIDLKLSGIKYIINQTFAWFEISLVVFIDNPDELTKILTMLRLAKLSDLNNEVIESKDYENLMNDSLFNELFANTKRINNVSLFSDTNSHFGINDRLVSGNLITEPIDSYIKDFELKAQHINLKAEIEWQVKPNHIFNLINILSTHDYLKHHFNNASKNTNLVLGKCDYYIQELSNNILSNFHLIRYINRKRASNCELFNHVRKVRTYVFLEADSKIFPKSKLNEIKNETEQPLDWADHLKKLAVSNKVFQEVETQLKAIKVSRQIRIKILKIFSNYNNGIQDPIQFPYFIDFRIFITNLIALIKDINTKAKVKAYSLRSIEKDLNINIQEFEEGYEVRFLNGYQFENISDFDLDFNNSIQQLLSSYGTLIHEYGKLFYEKNYYPIIQLNDMDTVSNYISINYFGHHLTSPEFIFATVTKEILNHLEVEDDDLKNLIFKFKNNIADFKGQINESYLDEMLDADLININYFAIDAIRFKVTFNNNFALFEHWFWTYHFQNSYNFDTNGNFNEQRLRMEIFRLLLIKRICNKSNDTLNCPTPEIFNLWDRHYNKIDIIMSQIINDFANVDKIGLLKEIYNKTQTLCDMTKTNNKFTLPIKKLQNDGFTLMLQHFKQNNEKVTSLKRDWISGIPIESCKDLYREILYAPDQTGGVFFCNCEKMQTYFKANAEYLLKILNFAAINKKYFITSEINNHA